MGRDGEVTRLPASPFRDEGVIVMAHRGGAGRWPENTMLAYQQAVNLGVDALEMDIHSTADGELVVIHDDVVDRVTNGQGPVHGFTLADLQRLDAGYRWTADGGESHPFRGQGATIPTLAEVFAAFPNMWINIDIKQSDPPIVEPFARLIRSTGMADRLCVGSFNANTVAHFRRACPEVATAATVPEVLRLVAASRLAVDALYWGEAVAMQLSVSHDRLPLVTPGFIRAAHRLQIAVHVWTVNDIAGMQRLIHQEVDGLMTDYPDLLLRLLGRYPD